MRNKKQCLSLHRIQWGFNGCGRFRKHKKGQTMTTLNYTTRQINREFKIKVSGIYEGKKINTLVGVAGLVRLVADIELTNRLLDRAFNSTTDSCVCKLRRGLKVSFYVY